MFRAYLADTFEQARQSRSQAESPHGRPESFDRPSVAEIARLRRLMDAEGRAN